MRDEKSEEEFIRRKLIGDAILQSVCIIGFGVFGPGINPYIQVTLGIFIAIVTAVIVSGIIIRSLNAVYPPTRKKWFKVGTIWGGFWGLGFGLIHGWGGGAFNFGIVPWIIGSVIFWSLIFGIVVSFGPHD